MSKAFYYYRSGKELINADEWPEEDYHCEVFRTGINRIFPNGFLTSDMPPLRVKGVCLLWWIISLLRHRKGFKANMIVAYKGQELVHYTGLTSRYFRFPFMGRRDLIFGPSRTHAEYRRQGLQSFALKYGITQHRGARGFWYVTDMDNIAPRRCVEKIGFRLIGKGERKRVGRFAPFIAYIIDKQEGFN